MKFGLLAGLGALIIAGTFGPAAMAAKQPDQGAYVITIKDQKFSPDTITIPANEKISVTVKNADATAAEFESSDLDREKVVAPGTAVTVLLGPLDPGTYGFFNDFHRESTGTVVVK